MKNKLPRFRTADEEARFWDTHDASDYLEHLEEINSLLLEGIGSGDPIEADKTYWKKKRHLLSTRPKKPTPPSRKE